MIRTRLSAVLTAATAAFVHLVSRFFLCFRSSLCFFFVFNVAYFEFIALFVFCWVLFSSTSQVFGWKKRLQNYQLRIEWNVKP